MKNKISRPKITSKRPAQSSLWVHGLSGRMGNEIAELLKSEKHLVLLGGSDKSEPISEQIIDASLIVDFSSTDGNTKLFKAISKLRNSKFLIGTTGLSDSMIAKWQAFAMKQDCLVVVAPNTSFGIYAIAKSVGELAQKLAGQDWDIEIVETHHNRKLDAPSGTALFLARMIAKSCPELRVVTKHSSPRSKKVIGIHALRGGGVVGEHEIRFIGPQEEITLSHRAFSRSLFSLGAIALSKNILASERRGFYLLEEFE